MCRISLGIGIWLVLLGSVRGRAEIIIDADATLDAAIHDDVRIIDGANPPTVVNIVDGAEIEGVVRVHDTSIVHLAGLAADLWGPFVNELQTYDRSTLNVAGAGGYSVEAYGSSQVSISLGAFFAVRAHDSATVKISDGLFEVFSADGSSSMDVLGGNGQGLDWMTVAGSAVVTIHGHNFNYPLGRIAASEGYLSGDFTTLFSVYEQGSIILVPAPSSLLLALSFVATVITAGCGRRRVRGWTSFVDRRR